jgi:anthranilate phosphoribosyltransferase
VLPTFRGLVSEDPSKDYWVVWNEVGVDELMSVVDCHVFDSARGEEYMLRPSELGLADRPFEDLLPVAELDQTVDHFLALLGGEGPTGAIDSIRLNAAALAINCEVASGWPEGLQMAADAMSAGEPARLIERMRAHGLLAAAKA